MTLREQCEAFLTKYGLGGLKSQTYEEAKQESTFIQDLERLCLRQQAVGLREAATYWNVQRALVQDIGDFENDTVLQTVIEWCEQRAREREGA